MVDSEDNYEESRFRKRTAKGREFHIELMKDQWTAAQRAWRKQLNKIENLLTDSNEITPLISERNLLETKMEILSEAHERLDDALEDDYETKRVVQEKYETWEREHSDALKRVNSRVTELKQERESTKSTATKSSRSSRRSSNDSRASKSSTLERKVDSAAKADLLNVNNAYYYDNSYCRCCMLSTFVDVEVERTAALKRQEDELRKFQLTKKLALAKAEMDAITKIEESESVISDEDRKDVLPVDVIDNRDLLNEYLITQASSVSDASLSTMETLVGLSPELPEPNPKEEPKSETPFSPRFNQSVTREVPKNSSVTFSTPKNALPTRAPPPASRSTEVVRDQSVNSPHNASGDTLERLAD
ncbi:hypothetical protein ACROYT_G043634 [Oculina patagonica]